MTILINGYVQLDPGNETLALEQARDLMAETRTQNGCRAYVWSADPAVPGRVYVYENWETEADLAAHLAGHYYADMLALRLDALLSLLDSLIMQPQAMSMIAIHWLRLSRFEKSAWGRHGSRAHPCACVRGIRAGAGSQRS